MKSMVTMVMVALLSFSFAQSEASSAAENPASENPAPEGAEVYFIDLEDGAELQSPVTIRFGLRNAGIAPAGMQRDGTGHHHLLINSPEYDASLPLPGGEFIRHFGGGQTETVLELDAGTYTFQLLFANYLHIPFEPNVVSKTITVTVVE